jgi:predicted nucleic acid-binding protein
VASDSQARLTVAAGRPGTLVDSSVILDIVTDDPVWGQWSAGALAQAGDEGLLVINPIVYAEVSVGFDQIEELDDAVPADDFRREALPYDAGFLAGKAFLAYRRRGGQKRSPLPDFYIGAHSAVRGYQLLTRDAARYRTYFPSVTVIAPDDDIVDRQK